MHENGPSRIMLVINPNTTFGHYCLLALTKVNKLNLPSDPCDPDYKLQTRPGKASLVRWAAGANGTSSVILTGQSARKWNTTGDLI